MANKRWTHSIMSPGARYPWANPGALAHYSSDPEYAYQVYYRMNPALPPSPYLGGRGKPYRLPDNGGPFLPEMFPYGRGGRPMTYATGNPMMSVKEHRDLMDVLLGMIERASGSVSQAHLNRLVEEYGASNVRWALASLTEYEGDYWSPREKSVATAMESYFMAHENPEYDTSKWWKGKVPPSIERSIRGARGKELDDDILWFERKAKEDEARGLPEMAAEWRARRECALDERRKRRRKKAQQAKAKAKAKPNTTYTFSTSRKRKSKRSRGESDRPLSEYTLFVSTRMREGYTMEEAARMWQDYKASGRRGVASAAANPRRKPRRSR